MRRFFPLAACSLVLAACGTPSAAPATPTPIPLKSYTDPYFHFSFKYPSTWSVPARGGQETTSPSGVRTYIVSITIPNSQAAPQVTLDGQVIAFKTFQEGHCAPDPGGGPVAFCYFHAHVSGWPAMRVNRTDGKHVDSVDTIVNTTHRSYDVRMVTAYPPFTNGVMAGYDTIVKTLKVPFD